jgi:hypothetical protein
MAPTRFNVGRSLQTQEEMRQQRKSKRSEELLGKLREALGGYSGVIEWNGKVSNIDCEYVPPEGCDGDGFLGVRCSSVEYAVDIQCWQLWRSWRVCPLGKDYGELEGPLLIEDDEEVVRLYKRWLLQGLR